MELGRLCVLASCAEPAPAKTGMCCRMVVGLASLAAKEPSQQHALKAQIEPHQRRASDIEPTPAAMARLGCTPQDAAQNCCMGFFALAHGQWDTCRWEGGQEQTRDACVMAGMDAGRHQDGTAGLAAIKATAEPGIYMRSWGVPFTARSAGQGGCFDCIPQTGRAAH